MSAPDDPAPHPPPASAGVELLSQPDEVARSQSIDQPRPTRGSCPNCAKTYGGGGAAQASAPLAKHGSEGGQFRVMGGAGAYAKEVGGGAEPNPREGGRGAATLP